jgi:hypothetical protein
VLKRSLVSITAIAVLAAVVALSGGAPAEGASQSAKAPTTGISGGRGTSKAGGLVQITAYSDNDGPTSTVVLTGAIGDFGKAVRTYANGVVVQQYNRLEFEVNHGSFQVKIADPERSLVSAASQIPTDLKTCSGFEIVRGKTPIVAGSGTGAYKRIRGTFNMTVTVNEVDSWPKCPRTGQTLLTQSVFVTGSGIVSFG